LGNALPGNQPTTGSPQEDAAGSETEAQLSLVAPWCDEMGPAKRGQEVVQRRFVGHVDDSEAQKDFVSVGVGQNVVHAQANVKQVSRRDARRVGIVILGPGRRNPDPGCAENRRGTTRNGRIEAGEHIAAEQADLGLLVARQSQCGRKIRHFAGYQTAVIPPGEAEPWTLFHELVLDVGCLLKGLVVVNPEDVRGRRGVEDHAADFGPEEAGARMAQNRVRSKTAKVGEVDSGADTVDL